MKYAGDDVYSESFNINNSKENLEVQDYINLRNEYYFDLAFKDADIYYKNDTSYVMKIKNQLTGNFEDTVNPQHDINVYARALKKDGTQLNIPVNDDWCDGLIDDDLAYYTELDMTFATHILPTTSLDDLSAHADGDEDLYGLDDQISKVFIRYDMVKDGKVIDSDLVIIDYATLLEFIMDYDVYNIKEPGFATGQWEYETSTDTGWHWQAQGEGLSGLAGSYFKYGDETTIDSYHWKDNSNSEGVASWLNDVYGIQDVAFTQNSDGEITMKPIDTIKNSITTANNSMSNTLSELANSDSVDDMSLKAARLAMANWPLVLIIGVVGYLLWPKGE